MVKSVQEYADEEVCMSGDEDFEQFTRDEWDSLKEDSAEFSNGKSGSSGRRKTREQQDNTIEVLVNHINNSSTSGNESAVSVSSCVSSTTDGSSTNGESTMLSPNSGRQIANCNERRRMQSINAGFQSLRQLLPLRKDREKMSKAAILQQTADFIHNLQLQKDKLAEENELIGQSKKRRLDNLGEERMDDSSSSSKADNSRVPPLNVLEYLRTIDELRSALTKEQQLRLAYEQELRAFEKEMLELRNVNAKLLNEAKLNSLATAASQNKNLSPRKLELAIPSPHFDPTKYLSSFNPSAAKLSTAYSLLMHGAQQQQHQEPGLLLSAIAQMQQQGGNNHLHQPLYVEAGGANNHHPPTSATQQPQLLLSSLANSGQHFKPGPAHLGSPAFGMPPTKMEECVSAGAEDNTSLSQRNLQSILEAIRHIEGTNNQQQPQHSSASSNNNNDLLVN
uniref:BHLH domain-containing protein n=1 Tax=Ditylenchus dipsaci TaxID=166011 RepID=A0A915D8T1_9BILA